MPDEKGNEKIDEEKVPDTSLHAHGDGREEDVEGDAKPDAGEEGDGEGVGNPVGSHDEEE
ncbi:MAG: hypothetical protein ACR2K6_01965 [Solirubrobacterales bacterium]